MNGDAAQSAAAEHHHRPLTYKNPNSQEAQWAIKESLGSISFSAFGNKTQLHISNQFHNVRLMCSSILPQPSRQSRSSHRHYFQQRQAIN